jgi:RNA polymerase sigma-70 factor (ECF subfamily)
MLDPDSSREQVFSLVYRQMRALTAAEWTPDFDDLVQHAAEQVLKALPNFEGRSQLSSWTFGICFRTWCKQRRSFKRWLRRFSFTTNGELPDCADLTLLSPHALERAERKVRLQSALSRLSPKRRTVVVLHDLEELPVEEIADIVGAKVNTVRSRLRDGRRELKELLRNDAYFGDIACSSQEALHESA